MKGWDSLRGWRPKEEGGRCDGEGIFAKMPALRQQIVNFDLNFYRDLSSDFKL